MNSRKRLVSAISLAAMTMAMPSPSSAQVEPLLGQMMYFAPNFCPRSWIKADGQLLAINQYQALYSLYGTTFGGDGRTTFALPDLRGRTSIGQGTGPGLSPYQLGQSGGLEQVTLSVSELPSHTHTFTGTQTRLPTSSQAPNTNSPDGSVPPTFPSGPSRYFDQQGDQTGMDINESLTLGVTGGSQAHENRSPFLGMTICIATTGVFPSRN